MALVSTLAGCQSMMGPTPIDGEWTEHPSTHFTLQVRPGSFADQSIATLAEWLEDQYAVSNATLELAYAGRVTGVLYPSPDEAGNMSDRSGTAYPETVSFNAVAVAPLDGTLLALVAHEANHVILGAGLGRAGTSMMREGLPSAIVSERYYPVGPTVLYSWTARNAARLPPLADLIDNDKWEGLPQDVAYNASASFLAYLIQVSGAAPMKRLYGATPNTFASRFQEAYGRSLAQAEAEWKAFCGI
jgi:hypothetical protein